MTSVARHPLAAGLVRLGVLLAALLSNADAQGLGSGFEVAPALKALATDDARLQRERFGDLAAAAGKPWLSVAPGELASVWRDLQWIVPGAAMRMQRGFCIATKCQGTDYLVRYDADAKQLEFVEQGSVQYIGHVHADGSVRMTGTGLVGVFTAETLRVDPAANVLYAEKNELRPATRAQLASATHGFVPDAGATAAQPASDAQLRAELAAMKAQVDALSKQVEQQRAAGGKADQPEPTPAEARAAERRAQREAKARAAEEKRVAAQAKAREEAQRRAEAQARARQEAQAKADEARRLAEERRAAAEERKRAAAQAQAAEASRIAEERLARQAARQAAQAQRVSSAQRQEDGGRAAKSDPVAVAAAAPATPAREGLYTTSGGYSLDIAFRGDTLVVKEPNKESPYTRTGAGFYEFTNPNNGIAYCMRVIDATTLEACKPGQAPGMGTRLTFAGGAGGASVPSGDRARFEQAAQRYASMAHSHPEDAQTWSFCSFAALAQATGGGQAQLQQAATALRSISTSSTNPCPDAIPPANWSAAQ